MRKIFTPVLAGVSLFLTAAPALAASVCIDTRQIASSTPQDKGSVLLFKMRDGTQWRNKLQGSCPDLTFNGYSWTVRNGDNTVCENQQSLTVLHSGETCTLGKFEKVAQSKAP